MPLERIMMIIYRDHEHELVLMNCNHVKFIADQCLVVRLTINRRKLNSICRYRV